MAEVAGVTAAAGPVGGRCGAPRDVAAAAVPRALLPAQLRRPRQRRLRRAHDEPRPRAVRRRVRVRGRALLHRLLLLRGAEQRHPAPRGRPAVDRPDHGDLGDHRLGHGLRAGRDQLLRGAVPARRRRGRVLPRHHPVPDVLVPPRAAGEGRRAVLPGRAAVVGDRGADLHTPHPERRRCARLRRRLAVHVLRRGDPRRPRRAAGADAPARPAQPRPVALRRRAAGAGAADRRRGQRAGAARDRDPRRPARPPGRGPLRRLLRRRLRALRAGVLPPAGDLRPAGAVRRRSSRSCRSG